jgi:uncharacterized phage protein (TIGR02220 family)
LKTKPLYKALSEKPVVYGRVWLYILGRVGENITLNEIATACDKSSKAYISEIIKWGLAKMKLHQIGFVYESNSKGINFKFDVINKVPKSVNEIETIIAYLNEKANKKFKSTSKDNIQLIEARIREGHTIDDFKKVIDNKTGKWKNTEQDDYLRPITLFGNKFISYLNENPHVKRTSNIEKTITTAIETATIDWGLDR